jgi:hypothetical protein
VNGKKRDSAAKPDLPEAIHQTAAQIHSRHPHNLGRRDIGIDQVEKKLAGILKHQHVPAHERAEFLGRINKNHVGWCACEQWTKDAGEYAKGLEGWLAPTKGRYLVEPPASATGQSESPRVIL